MNQIINPLNDFQVPCTLQSVSEIHDKLLRKYCFCLTGLWLVLLCFFYFLKIYEALFLVGMTPTKPKKVAKYTQKPLHLSMALKFELLEN